MKIRVNEEDFVIEDNDHRDRFPMGGLMLSHRDLNYLRTADSRIILQRHIPKPLRLQPTLLLQKNRFRALRADFCSAANKTKNIVRRATKNSLIFPCHKYSRIPYAAVTEDLLWRFLLLQEEITPNIAVIPLFRSPPSVRCFSSIEQMFSRIIPSTEKLKGAFLPSSFLGKRNCLTALRRSELDFFLLNARGVKPNCLEDFHRRLERLLTLEKPVFITDASLFVGDTLFAPRLSDTGVCGYSLPFVDDYIPSGPTYYDVSSAVLGRHKSLGVMVSYYGSEDFPLSNICGCSICRENTIQTFFSGEGLVPHEKNRLHKLEFAEISSSKGEPRFMAEAMVP